MNYTKNMKVMILQQIRVSQYLHTLNVNAEDKVKIIFE